MMHVAGTKHCHQQTDPCHHRQHNGTHGIRTQLKRNLQRADVQPFEAEHDRLTSVAVSSAVDPRQNCEQQQQRAQKRNGQGRPARQMTA